MRQSLFSYWDIVYYFGQLWRVVGPAPDGRLQLRRCGWEYGWGWWGWDSNGQPFNVAAQVSPRSGMIYHA